MLRAFIATLLVVYCWSAQRCFADDAEPPPGFSEAVDLGIQEYEQQNFAEARVQFLRAHTMYPTARTARALGMTEFELRNYPACIRYLERALIDIARPLVGAMREETEKLLERANAYSARVHLDVRPVGALVTADGARVDGTLLILPPGEHELEFHADNHVNEKRKILITGGESTSLSVRLVPVVAVTGPAPRARERSLYRNPWLWTAVGAVVAGAVVGMAVAFTRDRTSETAEPVYRGSSGARPVVAP